eukprot:m.3479 g.3479  ORF g.3479 m.3479 type:complete len:343 (+) comp9457_c0_seq1:2417-3445(+)
MSFNEFTDISLEYPCSYSPWLGETPIHSLVPSDCAYYEEESNGPFIGRSDPLLSSSASNLTTLVFETEKPAEKSTPKVLQPPSLAQLKQEDQLSLITSSLRSFPTENMAIRQEEAEQPQPSFKQESSGNVAFAFKIAANRAPAYFTVKQEATSTPVSVGIRPKASLGSLPSREVEGGVVSAGSDSASSRPCKRSARARSLRAPSMSSIASEDAYDDRDADVNNTDTDDDFDGQDDVERPSRKRSRRKDGSEDMSPCPARLMAINRQLAKLNEMMAEMTPVNVVPAHAKNKCRKERNKLASRCVFFGFFGLGFTFASGDFVVIVLSCGGGASGFRVQTCTCLA